MSGRRFVVALIFTVAALATACQPTFTTLTSSTPCYVGSFTLKTGQFTAPIQTPVGPESVSLVPGGSVTLTTTNGTWTLTASEQVSLTGAFTGQATVQATATGTFTATDSALDFTVSTLTGSVHVAGTVFGNTVDMTVQVPGSFVDKVIGLQGQANYSCSNGGLSLTFSGVHFDF